eukprot:Nk52_evm19s147 gene=Nk52_evmTU19s147
MPRYYCDYCDAFLTHDSRSVRRTHNAGRKHKEAVRNYYEAVFHVRQQEMQQEMQRMWGSYPPYTGAAIPPGAPPPPNPAAPPHPPMNSSNNTTINDNNNRPPVPPPQGAPQQYYQPS